MPAIDSCEPSIIRALEKEGWGVVKRSVKVKLGKGFLLADVRMRNEGQQIIVVEVKCFANSRTSVPELYTAIGQYLLYRSALEIMKNKQPIYLAVPKDAYLNIFSLEAVQKIVVETKIKMIVVDLKMETIETWLH